MPHPSSDAPSPRPGADPSPTAADAAAPASCAGAGHDTPRPFGGFLESALEAVAARRDNSIRLGKADGLAVLRAADLLGIGWLANGVRERLHGRRTYYNINRHIDYSNVCVNHCEFCAFSREKGAPGAWTRSLDEIFALAESAAAAASPVSACSPAAAGSSVAQGASTPAVTELHIVGGCHPDLPFEYYVQMLRGLRERLPGVHLKAFTAVEIAHFARLSGLKIEAVLTRLIEAGLGSLPGGGAEVLTPATRRMICGEKISARRWLNIHRTAHRLGLKTTCTMLYGHVESLEDRIDHLLALRALQDETGGFQAFVPLAFHPAHSRLSHLPGPSGAADLKTVAAARLLLDNIPHVKAYWVMLGVKTAQVAQSFGADDLDGTVVEETITHMAGAQSPQALTVKDLRRLIQETGHIPVERDSLYREVRRSQKLAEATGRRPCG
ncbi:MAG: CofH family radical SAM protein [bacterium]|nr:CofH family radical SAM protein [bacterium]